MLLKEISLHEKNGEKNNSTPEPLDKTFDEFVVRNFGQFGCYQLIISVLVALPVLVVSMDSLSWTFSGKKPAISENCSGTHVFESADRDISAIEKFDLICERSIIRAIIQSTYYVGQFFGSITFGLLGDRWGRKPVYFIGLVIQIFGGFGMSLSPYWGLYGFSRFLVGVAHAAIFVTSVIIGIELIGPKYRKLASCSTSAAWALGQVFLGVIAYFLRDYQYMHAVIATLALVFLSYRWLIPESPRWLVAHSRYNEANDILQYAAKINKITIPSNWYETIKKVSDGHEQPKRPHNYSALFKTSEIRKRSLVCFFAWPVCSMLYYGISMNSSVFGGDLYLTFILGGFLEIPASFVAYVLMDTIGRKSVIVGCYAITIVSMLSNLFITSHPFIGIMQALIAKTAMATAYTTMYVFTPELFPTVIRNTAMGACSMMARIGAITASFVAMWLVDSYGPIVLVIPFSLCGFAASIVILYCLPETYNKQLSEHIYEIEELNTIKKQKIVPVNEMSA